MFLALSHNENSSYYNLEIDNQIVGRFRLEPYGEKRLGIWGVFIKEDWRGKSLGQKMMEYAISVGKQICKEAGYSRLWLNVFANNHRARHIYEKLGFCYIYETSDEHVLEMEMLL